MVKTIFSALVLFAGLFASLDCIGGLSSSTISFKSYGTGANHSVSETIEATSSILPSVSSQMPWWLSVSREIIDNYKTVCNFTFTAKANCSVNARSASIKFSNLNGVSDPYVTVTQEGGTVYATPKNITHRMFGENGSINVNGSWGMRVKLATSSSWIKLPSSVTTTEGSWRCGTSRTIDYSVEKNASGKTRVGKIDVQYPVYPNDGGDWEELWDVYEYGYDGWMNEVKWKTYSQVTVTQEGYFDYEGDENGVLSPITINFPGTGELFSVYVNGALMLSTTVAGSYKWQPRSIGNHEVKCVLGDKVWQSTFCVKKVDIYNEDAPNPPTSQNTNISITPTTRNFLASGGGAAIIVSGSGTWTAAVSDSWLTLNASNGEAGFPVAYLVSANTNVETRTGYVYVSGHIHTVTQEGIGAEVDKTNVTVEHSGGSGTVNVTAEDGIVWQAKPNVDWISVSPVSGAGVGSVKYQVAPYNEISTRQGSIIVAGNIVTVFQYGRRMVLDAYSITKDYNTHVIPININALSMQEWKVTPNVSWISVVDAGNGKGGDLVSIAVAENPSYKARTGTVTIGTETFTVIQQGRTELSFSVNPVKSTASVNGAYAVVAVLATPDLPWTAKSGANWVAVVSSTASGSGNGNIVYSASPNSTLYDRTGTITVTPEKASGVAAKTHTVTQPAAVSALSLSGYEFEAAGETCELEVSVADIVEWKIEESLDWITVSGSTSRTGPGKVTLQAAENNTIYPRSGKVTIARKTFTVSQKGRGVEVEYDNKLFGTDGGYASISIHPDGNVSWTAVASDTSWITIFQGNSGTGDGEILFIINPYQGAGEARIGTITVGDKVIYITQRAYDLSIEPNGVKVAGNNGAGEFGVSAGIYDVWTAIVTEPWITIVDGYNAGTGSGTVRFVYAENTTGKMRTGKIIVAGEVYTIEQSARTMVSITAVADHGGSVMGSGSYDLGTKVTLTATPDSGYSFSYWTGDVESTQNPIQVTADKAKSVKAIFEPLPIAFTSVTSGADGVRLAWNNLAWATTYRIYRGSTSVPSSATVVAEIVNTGNCTYLDESGIAETTYWYWIEAEGAKDSVMSDPMTGVKEKPIVYSSITYTNLRGATHSNPETYLEGTLVSFTNPSYVTGYTFAGWIPSQITADMTGAQTISASWTANSYLISYNANGGSGAMADTTAKYDSEATIAGNGFTREGYTFKGWAATPTGGIVYSAGQKVTNLTAESNGVVVLYAVWTANSYLISYHANGGTGAMDDTTAKYDSEVAIAGNVFTREGYIFKGWAATSTGEVVYSAGQKVINLTTQPDGVIALFAVWELATVENPVITPTDGSTFSSDSCTVTITCSTPGAIIYYSTGRTPSVNDRYRYNGPFSISTTTTVTAFAIKDGIKSDYVEATITYVEAEILTLEKVLDASNLLSVETGGEAKWLPIEGSVDCPSKVGGSYAVSGEIVDDDEEEHSSWLKIKVKGKGTLSFWWRVNCEPDPRGKFTYDRGVLTIDGNEVGCKDGITEWMNYTTEFNGDDDTEHEIVWTYISDGWLPEDEGYSSCMWVDGITWTPVAVDKPDPIPELSDSATASEVASALAGSADTKLIENITTVADYAKYRAWALSLSGVTAEEVKASSHAWISYALDCNMLIAAEPKKGDVVIDAIESVATDGSFAFTVKVKDVSIGANALEANIRKLFGIEGVEDLSAGDFSSNSVEIKVTEVVDGNIRFTVLPKQSGGKSPSKFFIRVKMQLGSADEGGVSSPSEPTPLMFTVTFDANGGTGGTQKSIQEGSLLGLLPEVTREGYSFDNWWTAKDGGAQVDASTTVKGNVTYYAHWTKIDSIDRVQLWEGGPYWATTNIGAENPWDSGYYFWWGDTVGYKREDGKWVASDGVGSNSFSFDENTPTSGKYPSVLKTEGWITSENVLTLEHDAAHMHLGNGWRMPTKDELSALRFNCEWIWTTMNGVKGYLVRGIDAYASNSIFLPAAGRGWWDSLEDVGSRGYYWSSVLSDYNNYSACSFEIDSFHYDTEPYGTRSLGHSIRPVTNLAE